MSQKTEVKLKELFGFDNDTRKTNNRNPNILLSKYVKSIDELIKEGITIEQIEEIIKDNKGGDKILYKYLTQITLHLTVDETLKKDFLKGFGRNNLLIFNENKTLGIKYLFIDRLKKQTIYNTLCSVDNGWKIEADSSTYSAYKMERFTTKEEYLALYNKYKKIIDRVDKNLFGGYINISILQTMFGVNYLKLELSVLYIYKNNIDKLITQLLGYKSMTEVSTAMKSEEKRKKEEQDKSDLEYKKLRENREKEDEKIKNEITSVINNIVKKYNLKREVIGNIKESCIIGINKDGLVLVYKKTKTSINSKSFPYLKMDILKELNSILTLGIDKYISTKDISRGFKQPSKLVNIKNHLNTINSRELIILKKIS